jgi:hypothetical protein
VGLFSFFRKLAEQAAREPPRPKPLFSRVQEWQRTGPERPLIYAFEHHALRREVFEYHPELTAELAGTARRRPFWHAVADAETVCERHGWVGHAPAGGVDPYAGPYAAEQELLERVSVHPHRRAGHTVYVLALPEPAFAPEAHFIAIVHRDDEPHEYMTPSPSTRYFTLERTEGSPQPLPCEWGAGGTHANFGTHLAPDMAAFADWVFARVRQQG